MNSKTMQDQVRKADPDTAKSLEENLRRNEILRLTEQMNKPIFSSSPASQDATNAAKDQLQKLLELNRQSQMNMKP